ncbi:rhodanese-like domain-containing protein [Phaeovibrio sulfidiphilus]|uniref:Rhodanese-like domain-containing protein n=1 Tax=Phaeovibrio sulfidiphilus TaxID=1220600 RepID=A0A8J7CRM1_9PROT|nr:rhodanese-like domain-containing protein [Phaeovibrio sulfidiphilus]MBE1237710.1 rhodanese-like domain-containing protein [Phaeovibrio sulfidiphilus]
MDSLTQFFNNYSFSWSQALIVGAVIVGVLLIRALPKAMAAGVPFISAESIAKRLANGEEIVIIDVNSPASFAQGHIPGAINIPLDQVPGRLGSLPAEEFDALSDTQVVLTCDSGSRGMAAARFFKGKGFLRTCTVAGGNRIWRKAGLPWEGTDTGTQAQG